MTFCLAGHSYHGCVGFEPAKAATGEAALAGDVFTVRILVATGNPVGSIASTLCPGKNSPAWRVPSPCQRPGHAPLVRPRPVARRRV